MTSAEQAERRKKEPIAYPGSTGTLVGLILLLARLRHVSDGDHRLTDGHSHSQAVHRAVHLVEDIRRQHLLPPSWMRAIAHTHVSPTDDEARGMEG
jgi:hypothetical protein